MNREGRSDGQSYLHSSSYLRKLRGSANTVGATDHKDVNGHMAKHQTTCAFSIPDAHMPAQLAPGCISSGALEVRQETLQTSQVAGHAEGELAATPQPLATSPPS